MARLKSAVTVVAGAVDLGTRDLPQQPHDVPVDKDAIPFNIYTARSNIFVACRHACLTVGSYFFPRSHAPRSIQISVRRGVRGGGANGGAFTTSMPKSTCKYLW